MRADVAARFRAEWRSREVAALSVAALALAWAPLGTSLVGGDLPGGRRAYEVAVNAMVDLGPTLGLFIGALVSGRDSDIDARSTEISTGGHPGVVLFRAAAVAVMFTATTLVIALAVPLIAGTVITGLGRPGMAGRAAAGVQSLVLVAPLGVAWGLIVGANSRSRVAAVGRAALLLVAFLIVERLATQVAELRWVHLALPVGLADFIHNGSSSQSLPRTVSPLLAAVVPVMALAVAAVRPGRRRKPRTRPRATLARVAAVIFVAGTAFGATGSSALSALLPWQMSPVWAFDRLNRSTPERAVDEYLRRLAKGDARASELVVGGQSAPVNGLLEAVMPLRSWSSQLDVRAPTAGIVAVRYTAESEPHMVTACTTRTPSGWNVRTFSLSPDCLG